MTGGLSTWFYCPCTQTPTSENVWKNYTGWNIGHTTFIKAVDLAEASAKKKQSSLCPQDGDLTNDTRGDSFLYLREQSEKTPRLSSS